MVTDSFEGEESQLVDALCAYQMYLHRDVPLPGDSAIKASLPADLQPRFDKLRRCIDLLDGVRNHQNATVLDPRDPSHSALPGYHLPSHIGRFIVVEQLGIGGFGIVFRAMDPTIRRDVAIKIPKPEFLRSMDLLDRFASEAVAVALLDHPNIVPIYESGRIDDTPYFVMPYIPGKTLGQWRSEQETVSHKTAAQIIRQLAKAVAHAHERGVLHRDLKPGNVLLAPRDAAAVGDDLQFTPKLTDFGVAKCGQVGVSNTLPGTLIGTASYMPPEQADARRDEITARSDVYGLGAILYELLTGNPPFHGTNQIHTIQQVVRDDPRTFHSQQLQIPIDLQVICLKCLEKSPANRYPTAIALAEDLQRFLKGEPIWARPISTPARIKKWCRRNALLATVLSALVIGMLAMFGITLWYNSLLNTQLKAVEQEREAARRHQARSELHQLRAQQNELAARKRAYVADMRNAKNSSDQGNTRQALKLLDRYRPKHHETDIRDFAWWYLWRDYEESSRVLAYHGNGDSCVAVNRQNTLAASAGVDGIIQLWSLPSGTAAGQLHGQTNARINSLDFSPSGDRLVSAGDDGAVCIWDVVNRRLTRAMRDHVMPVCQALFSPDGDLIASGGEDHMVRVWNAKTAEVLAVLLGHDERVRCLAFHPLEPTLATGSLDGTVRLWDLSNLGPEPQIVMRGLCNLDLDHYPRALAFEPLGKSLAVATAHRQIVQLSLQPENYLDETDGILFTERLAQPRCLIWPRPEHWIAGFGTSELRLYDPHDPEQPIDSFRGHLDAAVSLAATPDGTCLLSGSTDGTVRLWPNYRSRTRIVDETDPGPPDDEFSEPFVQWKGNYLAIDFQHEQLVLMRMPGRQVVRHYSKANDDDFTLSPHGRLLLMASRDGLVNCHRIADGQLLWNRQVAARPYCIPTEACAFDESEELAAVACGRNIVILSVNSSQVLQTLEHPKDLRHVTFVESPTGSKLIVSTCFDGILRFWDVATGNLIRQQQVDRHAIDAMAVSKNRRLIAWTGSDRQVRVCRLDDFAEISILSGSNQGASAIGFMMDSKILYHASRGPCFWSVTEEDDLLEFPLWADAGRTMAISPDGQQIALPQRNWIRLIDGRSTSPRMSD